MSKVIRIDLTKEAIDGIISESESYENAFLDIYARVTPHWDWVKAVPIGSIKVNRSTAEYIIEKLRDAFPAYSQNIMMLWLNNGFSSVDGDTIPKFKVDIDMMRIEYKEEIENGDR